jgi:hypothetical protein
MDHRGKADDVGPQTSIQQPLQPGLATLGIAGFGASVQHGVVAYMDSLLTDSVNCEYHSIEEKKRTPVIFIILH